MFFRQEPQEKRAALGYKDNDFGLFEAIADEKLDAIKGLIAYFKHNINFHVMGGGYRDYDYSEYPTPLSFALSRDNVNIEVVKLLIELGADITEEKSIQLAKKSQSREIRDLFNLPEPEIS